MKKFLLLIPLWFAYASAAVTYPIFPAYDPFVNATGSGGTSYAVGNTLAGQTNAMGQYWYYIGTSTSNANAIKVTATALSYQGLPGFSGNAVLLTNASGMGARMFTSTNTADTGFIEGAGTNFYYSVVLVVSNFNNLTNDYIIAVGDQGTIAGQNSQPGTAASALYFEKVVNGTATNFVFGLAKQLNQTASYDTTLYTNGQVIFVVVDYEIGATALNSSPGTTGTVRLWVNPSTNTFGAQTQPAATINISGGNALTPYISCVQIYDNKTDTPNDVYLTDFRTGTNWSWVTGGPGIGFPLLASTNCGNGALNLAVTAMNNGTPNGYQWQFNGNNLTNGPSISGSGAAVSGANTAALAIGGMDTSVAQLDSGSYTVIVTNAYGAVTSSVATVTAFSTPIITVQPSASSLRLFMGATSTVSLAAIGEAPLSYYWYTNNTLDSAVTSPNFLIAGAQANGSFYGVVSNSIGTATSTVVSLTVVSDPAYPYPLAVFNDHPIGFWPLNEVPDNNAGDDGTNAYDYLGGNNGYYTNSLLGQQCYAAGLAAEYGYSPATDTNSSAGFAQFASINSYVAQIPNINFASNYAPSFSVEAWVNALGDTEVAGAGIVNKGYGAGGEQFTLDYDGGWRFYVRNAADGTAIALSTNTSDANWHHLVGVLDAGHSNITIYVDGEARTNVSFNPSAGILSSTNAVVIGSRMSSASATSFDHNFAGDIQNVAIYGYALSAAQVVNHYYAAGIGPNTALPSSTNVDEGTTLTVNAGATGSPVLAYQWNDSTSAYPGTPLMGQTNANLVISNISAAAYDGHSVDVTVTNIYGQTTSGTLLLSVVAGAPNSVAVTPSPIAVYAGQTVLFTVTAQGSQPFFYQWSTNGTPVPGATNIVYTNISAAAGSYTIGCEVTNHVGPGTPATASLTVVAAPSDFYGATVLKDSPVAFWRLDEPANATTAYDYAGGHNATYTSAVNGQSGFSPVTIPSETSTVFGTNNVAPSYAEEINDSANGIPLIDFSTQGANAEFSVEMWAKELPQNGDLLCKGYPNNSQFALDGGGSDNSIRFVVHNAADSIYTVNSGSFVPDGNWHHLVGVCDQAGGLIYIYADGIAISTAAFPTGTGLLSLTALYPVVIASQESSGGGSFTGVTNAALSEVALYDYAMSSTQVVAHYYAASFVPPTISAVRSGTNIVITYTGSSLLQAASIHGPWSTNTAATSPYTIPATNAQMFFKSGSIP